MLSFFQIKFYSGEDMEHYNRRVILYKILKNVIRPFCYFKYNYKCERVTPTQKPYILISNHTTLLDPVFVGLSFKDFMYFMASMHLKGGGISSKLLDYVFAPIYRLKTSSDLTTVKKVVKTIKDGKSVVIFAEGQRTPNGRTLDISEATGKLVKLCKCSLITYRIDGGYLSDPRWAKHARRGKMYGHKVNEYSPQALSEMSVDEINEIIARDIYENAYERQRTEMISYKGKALIQGAEAVLYLCASCKSISSMKSNENELICDCGLKLSMDEYGYFHKKDDYDKAYFDNILDWDIWQKDNIKEIVDNMPDDKPITSDTNQTLTIVSSYEEKKGTFYCYKDRFVFEQDDNTKLIFLFSDIVEIEGISKIDMIFSTSKDVFVVKTQQTRSPFKYIDIYNAMKKENNI